MTENQITQVIQAIEYIADNIASTSITTLTGDGTGWTIADSLENLHSISESLESIANSLKIIANR